MLVISLLERATTIQGSMEPGGNVPWGVGSPVLHMLKGLSRVEGGGQGPEAELMGQNPGSSADTLAQKERISGNKGTTVECATGSTRSLF